MAHSIIAFSLLSSVFVRILKIFFGNSIYVVLLFPLIVIYGYRLIVSNKKQYHLHKIDLLIAVMLLLLFCNLFLSYVRGVFDYQLILVLYVIIPVLIYPFFRLIKYDINSFSQLIFKFTLIYSFYIVLEFCLYYFYPEFRNIGTSYLKDVVGTSNFISPYVEYPIIGYATKPWGPMLDASASGAFLVVLFSFLYDSKRYVSLNFYRIVLFFCFLAIFLSGSKSAYVMFLIYIGLRSLVFGNNRLTFSYIFTNIFIFIFLIISALYLIYFFFSDGLLYFYINAMLLEPIRLLFSGIYTNGLLVFIGLGQESSNNIIYGLGEVDYINAIFRYGLLFTFLFTGLMFYIILKSKAKYTQFCCLFTMFLLSMNHYQIALKYPASILLFMAVAVFVNEECRYKSTHYLSKK